MLKQHVSFEPNTWSSICFVHSLELQFRPPDPVGSWPVGQVQRVGHQVHHQGGRVCQASAGFHWPDHCGPDHSAQSRLPWHLGRSISKDVFLPLDLWFKPSKSLTYTIVFIKHLPFCILFQVNDLNKLCKVAALPAFHTFGRSWLTLPVDIHAKDKLTGRQTVVLRQSVACVHLIYPPSFAAKSVITAFSVW